MRSRSAESPSQSAERTSAAVAAAGIEFGSVEPIRARWPSGPVPAERLYDPVMRTLVPGRPLFRLVLGGAAAGLLAACGSAGAEGESSPSIDTPATTVTPTEIRPPLCDNLSLFITSADQLADGTMISALEGLPPSTALSRAIESAEGVGVFGSLLGDELPPDLKDDVTVIRDAAAAFNEHLQAGGEPADVYDFTDNDEVEQARETLRNFIDSDC